MNNRSATFVSILILGIAGATAARTQTTAPAALKGAYGYTYQGSIGQSGLAVGQGSMMFDGAGSVSGTETIHMYPLGAISRAFSGTIMMNPDGSGTLRLNYEDTDSGTSPLAIANFSFVAVDGQKELKFIQTDPGFVVSGSAVQENIASGSALKGTYLYTVSGGVGGGGSLAGVGRLAIGDGNTVTGSESVQVYPLGLVSRTYEGMVVVSPDGMHTLKVSYTDDSGMLPGAGTFSFFVVNATKELRLIQVDPGFLVSGVAKIE